MGVVDMHMVDDMICNLSVSALAFTNITATVCPMITVSVGAC